MVLADYNIPGFDGLKALEIVKQKKESVPVVFMTGTLNDELSISVLEAGASDVVLKDRPARLPFAIARAHKEAKDKKNLTQAREDTLRIQRAGDIGKLASGVAHDLNNKLAPAFMFLSYIEGDLSEEKRKLLKITQNSLKDASEMVKSIMTFIRGSNGGYEVVNIIEAIRKLHDFVEGTFPNTIDINISIGENIPNIYGDEVQIRQVLLNFCINAKDAMDDCGQLDIFIKREILKNSLMIKEPDRISGEFVKIGVRDSGKGMSQEIADKIFEPFYTTKPIGKGTGIGLSYALDIAKAHNGYINFISFENSGSTFCLYLPLVKNEVITKEGIQNQDLVGNGEVLLIVDDERGILDVNKLILESFNYKVLAAQNGIEALNLYRVNYNNIHVIITDMKMPMMDGPLLIEHIKSINPSAKIIGLTGVGSENFERSVTGVVFISKPCHKDKLLEAIKNYKNL